MAVGDHAPPHTDPENNAISGTQHTNGEINSDNPRAKLNNYNHRDEKTDKSNQPEGAPFLDNDVDDEDHDPDYQCGWFGIACACLKPFRSAKWALALLCLSSVMQGFIVNGLLNVVISTIEKVRGESGC